MRSFVPAIYDVTVAIPKTSPPPTMLRLFKGQPSVVRLHTFFLLLFGLLLHLWILQSAIRESVDIVPYLCHKLAIFSTEMNFRCSLIWK